MQTKSCELDTISSKLLRKLLPSTSPFINKLVNVSWSWWIFAKNWKIPLVKPLLKKVGLDLNHSNYRSVSNLSFLSIVVEKCMLKHFNRHCTDNHLFPDYQSAYRQNYSCKTALVKLVNNIFWSMEWQCITALVAIDLLVAFDTVDHTILLKVLKTNLVSTTQHCSGSGFTCGQETAKLASMTTDQWENK